MVVGLEAQVSLQACASRKRAGKQSEYTASFYAIHSLTSISSPQIKTFASGIPNAQHQF